MLPIKLIRSITPHRRAQAIGEAISVTNERAALDYLLGTQRRLDIEKAANSNNEVRLGEKWIIDGWSKHYSAKRKKTKP